MTQRIRSLKRQLNEAEEETSRKDTQYRHTQRELSEERESNSRLQRQLLDQHLQMKSVSHKHTHTHTRDESFMTCLCDDVFLIVSRRRNESRQTLEKLKLLDLSIDEEDEQKESEPTDKHITQV